MEPEQVGALSRRQAGPCLVATVPPAPGPCGPSLLSCAARCPPPLTDQEAITEGKVKVETVYAGADWICSSGRGSAGAQRASSEGERAWASATRRGGRGRPAGVEVRATAVGSSAEIRAAVSPVSPPERPSGQRTNAAACYF